MKMRNSSPAVSLAVGLVVCALMGIQARAAILIYDSFTAVDGTLLQGHTPDITIGAASWTGAGEIIGGKAATGFQDTYIAFAPVSNNVYTLSAEIMKSADVDAWGGPAWVVLAFSKGNNWWGNGVVSTWVDSSGQVYSGNFGAADGRAAAPFTVAVESTHTYSVVLDTTGTDWTANWFFDGAATPWYSHTYTGAPSIDAIMMYRYGSAGGTFDDLTLSSAAVPEPSAAALLASGIVGLLARAWRKRR